MLDIQKAPAQAKAGLPLERKDDSGGLDGEKAVREFKEAWNTYREKNDARLDALDRKLSDPIGEAELKKIDEFLDKHEGLNQKLVLGQKAQEAVEELKKRFDAVETALQRKGVAGAEEKVNRAGLWAKAVYQVFHKGEPNLAEEERGCLDDIKAEYKALNVGTATEGGYLAPVEYVREIIKGITESSPVRSLVRVRNTSSKSIQIPKRTGQFAAVRVHELGTKSETTGLGYGLEELVAPEMYALVDVTNDMLEDSAFDIAAEIEMEAIEQFSVKEGQEFITGTGVGEMEGILVNGDIAETVSGSATAITADGMLDLKHAIKSGYARNANWLMNRTTIGVVRKLKDINGAYIWTPGIAQGAPNTIDGDPYVEVTDMPNEGAGAYPIAYGDWRRAYTMVDRIVMDMMRDPYTQADNGKVRFRFRRRSGGKLTLAEAVRKLKCST